MLPSQFPKATGEALCIIGKRLVSHFLHSKSNKQNRQCWYDEIAATAVFLFSCWPTPFAIRVEVSTLAVFLRREKMSSRQTFPFLLFIGLLTHCVHLSLFLSLSRKNQSWTWKGISHKMFHKCYCSSRSSCKPNHTVPKTRQISENVREEVPWRENFPVICGNDD